MNLSSNTTKRQPIGATLWALLQMQKTINQFQAASKKFWRHYYRFDPSVRLRSFPNPPQVRRRMLRSCSFGLTTAFCSSHPLTVTTTATPCRRRFRHCRHKSQPTIAMTSPIAASRVTLLKAGKEPRSTSHVMYWMSNSLRTSENPSLEQAAYLSNRLQLPLRVIHILEPVAPDGDALPERHALFQLQSVLDVSSSLRLRNIPFAIYHCSPCEDHEQSIDYLVDLLVKNAQGSASVIVDADYLKRGRLVRKSFAKRLTVPVYVVEANVIVPVREVSDKAEYAARTIRPKINRLVPSYLSKTPVVSLKYQQSDSDKEGIMVEGDDDAVRLENEQDLEKVLENWKGLDRDGRRVDIFKGGEIAAKDCLKEFIQKKLSNYAENRNEPALQLTSDLSPYLRFGNISPIDIVISSKQAKQDPQFKNTKSLTASLESFLEELIVRRELSVNACWFNEGYDKYETALPSFAQISLEIHKSDKRSHIYTYEEIEAGITHDTYWNAAQLELITRGKMHGYMRMYWAKQILGWVEDPKEALRLTIKLNNRWELDAVDPNSYVGVNWCYGLHDRGWTERQVWGKVRFMNEAGLKRKFNMPAYIAMVETLVKSEGLPKHISTLRKERNFNITQSTFGEVGSGTGSRKKARSSSASRSKGSSSRAVKRVKS